MAPPLWLSEQPQFGAADTDAAASVSFFDDQLGSSAVSSWWDGSPRKKPATHPDSEPGPVKEERNQPLKETIRPSDPPTASKDSFGGNPTHHSRYPSSDQPYFDQYDQPLKPKTKGKGSSRKKGNRHRPEEPSFYEDPSHRASNSDSDRHSEPSYGQATEIPEYYAPESAEKSPIRKRPSLLKADAYPESGYVDQVGDIPEYYAPEPVGKSPSRKRRPSLNTDTYLESGYPDQVGQIPEYYAPEPVEKSPGHKRRPPSKSDAHLESGYPDTGYLEPRYPDTGYLEATYPETGYPDQGSDIPEYSSPKSTKKSPTRKRPSQLNAYPEDLKSAKDPSPVFNPELDFVDQKSYPSYPTSGDTYEDPFYQGPIQSKNPSHQSTKGSDDNHQGASVNKKYNSKTPASENYQEPSKKNQYDNKDQLSHPQSGDNHDLLQLPPLFHSDVQKYYYEDTTSGSLDKPMYSVPEYNSNHPRVAPDNLNPDIYFQESIQKPKRPTPTQQLNLEKENNGYAAGASDQFPEHGNPDYFQLESTSDTPKRRRKPQTRPHSGKKASGKPQHDILEQVPPPADHVKDGLLPDENESVIGLLKKAVLPPRPLPASDVDDIQEITKEKEVPSLNPSGNYPARRRRPARPKVPMQQDSDPFKEEPSDVSLYLCFSFIISFI